MALDDGVPSLDDVELGAGMDLRLRVVQNDRRLGQRGDDVEEGDGPRRFLDSGRLGGDLLPQRFEQLLLPVELALVRPEGLLLVLLQCRGDVPLAGGDRLLPVVVVGHRVQVRLGDLDVVAEHAVEADLGRGDAGALALRILERGDVPLGVPADGAQLVERRVDAVADASPVVGRDRRIVHERRLDGVANVGDVIELRDQTPRQRRAAIAQQATDPWNDPYGLPQRDEVPRPSGAERNARDQPFEIVHRLERVAQLRPLGAAEGHLLDCIEPVLDRLERVRRPLQPRAQQPPSHRRHRAVYLAQQRTGAAAVRRLEDLEVPAGGRVHQHVLRLRPEDDAPDMHQIDLLGVPKILHERAGSPRGRRVIGQVGAFEGGLQLVAERLLGVVESERPGLERRDRQVPGVELRQDLGQLRVAGHDDLPRSENRQLVGERLPAALAGVLRGAELARRQVDQRGAVEPARGPVCGGGGRVGPGTSAMRKAGSFASR